MNISVVLLQYDFSNLTKISLASIRENEPSEIILVDNGSQPIEFEWARGDAGIKLIRLDQNIGYMRGMNVGWQAATSEYIALCNNDIALSSQCLRRLQSGLEADPDIGWLAACYQDGAWQSSRTAFPEDIRLELNETHGANRANFNAWAQSLGEVPALEYPALTDATVVMVRRSVSQAVGYYWDELFNCHVHDYALRLKNAGLKIAACKNAVFWHSTLSPTIMGHADVGPWRRWSDVSIQKMNERWGNRWKALEV